jgi:hypothetical protein
MISYLVSEFAKGELSNLVKECFGTDFPDIFKKKQVDYIYRYLNDLQAKSVLLEPEYIDKDYLEDYNHYYVKCFGNNGFMSARLHFFSQVIDHQKMTDYLVTGDLEAVKSIQDSYLGFVVIKPLSKTFIGRTCLKTYASINEANGRKRCLAREYKVDLFGIPLSVSTVAFQEQDKVVSACATTAIWSSLHAMYWKGVREIRSCSEITTNALNHINGSSNSFPNRELSNKQILRALDFEKLKHHTVDLLDYSSTDFFNTVKTHIDSKIPLILGVDVYSYNNGKLVRLDGHAVTIVGYKKSDKASIYVHDDRLGPYARANFFDIYDEDIESDAKWGLALQEKNDCGKWVDPHEVLIVNSLIIPTPHKVRLPSSFAQNTGSCLTLAYNDMLNEMVRNHGEAAIGAYREKLTFEIALGEISELRQSIYTQQYTGVHQDYLLKEKVKFLTGSYARYQWVATFSFDGEAIFKILFDATDIPQGNAVSAIFVIDKEMSDFVLEWHKKIVAVDSNLPDEYEHSFYGSFLKYLKPKSMSLSTYLDDTFGELRAPKYIKSYEMLNGDILNSTVKTYYCSIENTLEQEYETIIIDNPDSLLIWTISSEGALLIGREECGRGHPTLTGFKPSRIAGEVKLTKAGWIINAKSGRYSSDYNNTQVLLANAEKKFKDIFRNSRNHIYTEKFILAVKVG